MIHMSQWPEIIILNGTSSAGKTTLAKAMQDDFIIPYLHCSFDTLIMLAPKRYWEDAASPEQSPHNAYLEQGVRMIEVQKNGQPKKIEAVFGPVFQSIIDAMPLVVAELVATGNKVIFDQVYHNQKMFDDCKRAFAPYHVLRIGVHCPLNIVEERERMRGDRVLGRARGLYDLVHQYGQDDLSIDTGAVTIEQAVIQVKKYLGIRD
ncbi:chloramphenicol phosphotransferase CPT family protein [Legionella sainthelensi]|nr:chemotaxis protein [Legionella sainthelensi]